MKVIPQPWPEDHDPSPNHGIFIGRKGSSGRGGGGTVEAILPQPVPGPVSVTLGYSPNAGRGLRLASPVVASPTRLIFGPESPSLLLASLSHG